MSEPPPDQPQAVKILPRLRVRKRKAKKSRPKTESAAPAKERSDSAEDDLGSILRLLERLSEKPAGRALLESLLSGPAADKSASQPPSEPLAARRPPTARQTSEPPTPPSADSESPPSQTASEPATPPASQAGVTQAAAPSTKTPLQRPQLDQAAGKALEEALLETESEDFSEPHPAPSTTTPAERTETVSTPPDSESGASAGGSVSSFLSRHRARARRRAARRAQPQPDWRAKGARALRIGLLAFLAGAIFISCLAAAYTFGRQERRRAENAARLNEQNRIPLSPSETARLETALNALREGDPDTAAAALSDLALREPPIPSLSYLRALAALQAGDNPAAARFAEDSINRGERVSDSYAVLAQARPAEAQSLLEQAIAADPANSAPHSELAFLKRKAGNNAETLRLLRSARIRLLPVNAHTATEVTEHLVRLEDTTDADLPSEAPGSTRVTRLWTGAYLALRQKNPAKAEENLSTLLIETDLDTFRYILSDPAFRLYLSEPRIERFFRL